MFSILRVSWAFGLAFKYPIPLFFPCISMINRGKYLILFSLSTGHCRVCCSQKPLRLEERVIVAGNHHPGLTTVKRKRKEMHLLGASGSSVAITLVKSFTPWGVWGWRSLVILGKAEKETFFDERFLFKEIPCHWFLAPQLPIPAPSLSLQCAAKGYVQLKL